MSSANKIRKIDAAEILIIIGFFFHFLKTKKSNIFCKNFTIFLIISNIFGLGFESSAEVYGYYRGTRSLGMGGADVAVVNDETALLVNPAALGKLRDQFGTLIDPEIDYGDKLNGINKAKTIGNYTSLEKVSASLLVSPDTHYHYKSQFFPSFVLRNFGIGVFNSTQLDARMNSDGTALSTHYYNDQSLILGYSLRFFDGRIKIGFNVKAMNRISVVGDIDPNQSLALKDNAKTGSAIGNDIALVLSAPWSTLPTITAVIRDYGDTTFRTSSYSLKTDARPDVILQDIDVGIAFFPIHNNRTRSSFTFEYKHLNKANLVVDKNQLYHLGYEFNLADIAFFRLGMNGIYWTAGFELSSERFQFQMAYYGEEVGLSASALEEDRRLSAKVAYRF